LGKQIQNGKLRKRLQNMELEWRCPEHLKCYSIELDRFPMELLLRPTGGSLEDDLQRYRERGVILQLHGGGYYNAMNNKHRRFAGLYNEVSDDMAVLTIDYRVAPKHPYPAALEDAEEAYEWLLSQGISSERIFVVGDSAGGGLALALTLKRKALGQTLPAGIVTMSAWTDLTQSGASYRELFYVDPLFGGSKDTLVYNDDYYAGQNPAQPYISPIFGDYQGFPPMLMQVGEYEMLLSDSEAVAAKAKEQGVSVQLHVYSGMFHVFQYGELLYPEAKQAWVEVGRFLRRVSKRGR
jgi:acetyl esterase/lipase